MRVTCLIDSLNSGGAQRQICMLAIFLKQRDVDVRILTYHKNDFFRPLLDAAEVPVETVLSKNKILRFWDLRKNIRTRGDDVVISYLNASNLFAEVAGFPFRNFGLIVSERNTDLEGRSFKNLLRLFGHYFADAIVSNSHAQHQFIVETASALKSRTLTIMNCVDLEMFTPAKQTTAAVSNGLQILVVGRFWPQKNCLKFLEAIDLINKENPELDISVDWYGNNFFVNERPSRWSFYYLQLQQAIKDCSLENVFRLHEPEADLLSTYRDASVFCLPSIYEGCSNVICEAMACGKPILASRVGDNERLVADGENGYLFDPNSPREMADAILKFNSLSESERKTMGEKGRAKAELLLSPDAFVDNYLNIIKTVAEKKRVRSEYSIGAKLKSMTKEAKMINPLKFIRSPYSFYRLANRLYRWNIPLLPSLIDYFVRWFFACWLPHTAQVGKRVVFGYGGLSVVIHKNAIIGNDVLIGHCVTLGGNARQSGPPQIGNNVYIGCGAKILGPIKIGDGAVIGANAVVLKDVPEGAVVAGIPAKIIKEKVDIDQHLYHLKNK